MSYNELRKDYLLDRWVVIATARGKRPTDFAKQRTEPAKTSTCPLCPGNEHMTPPAVLVYEPHNGGIKKEKETGDARSKNWLLRCIPNMFPAFAPPVNPDDATHIIKSSFLADAIGDHEVLIESANHTDHPADAPLQQVRYVVDAYKDRLTALAQKPYVKYVQFFRNHGVEAGASLSHAHSQIVATPFVPSIPAQEKLASQAYFASHGTCPYCDTLKAELQSPRAILNGEHFGVFTPYASVNPMEFWIIPKRHAANFLDLTDAEAEELAATLKTTLKALKDLLNDPPYNYGIHLFLNPQDQQSYHWHLEVYPKLATWAGFEKSTGIYINTVSPENAAAALKNQIEQV